MVDMERAHKVWLSKLASLAFKLNAELDEGSFIPLDDAFEACKTSVTGFLRKHLKDTSRLSLIDKEDDITISGYFERTSVNLCPDELGIHKNGICWLLALTIEMMQQEEWTTYDLPDALS